MPYPTDMYNLGQADHIYLSDQSRACHDLCDLGQVDRNYLSCV